MAKVEIFAGACGMNSIVEATMNSSKCALFVDSECDAIERLVEDLGEVDPFQEISFRDEGPKTLRLSSEHCYHTACPVPVGIIKAVEIVAGLNLPVDASIKFIED
ncbi:MAG TPA: hypothetical protein G4N96_07940 [Chloroflexi bacterium]|nr:hypothetical protein [Chloroflexota bacterium]